MIHSNGRIRVQHIITDLDVGGAEATLCKLMSAHDSARFQMSVVSLTDIGEIGEQIREVGIDVSCIGMRCGRITPSDLWRVRRAVKAASPQVVQTWLYHSDFVGGIAAKSAGVPVVWGIRSLMIDPSCVKRGTFALRKVCAKLSPWVPAKIVACAVEAQRLHESLGYRADKMTVIPNGYDLNIYRPDPAARLSVREELGVAAQTRLVGTVGRFDPQKDHRNFLEACKLIAAKLPETRFLLCGKGVALDNSSLKQWVNELGLGDRVHLLGPRQDVARLLAALDVFALSSRSEAFPNVVAEAMACGVPCAVTNVGDAALIVGDTGKVVPSRDARALAEACRELLQMPDDEREQLGSSARKRIETQFSIQAVTARYEALYTELARQCAD